MRGMTESLPTIKKAVDPTVEVGLSYAKVILSDDIDAIKLTIESNVRLLVRGFDAAGQPIWDTALNFAAEHGKLEIIRMLLASAYGDKFTPRGIGSCYRNFFSFANLVSTSFVLGFSKGENDEQYEVVQELRQALFPVIASENTAIVSELLQDPRTLLYVDKNSCPSSSALYSSPVYAAMMKGNIDIVRLFLATNKYNIDKPVVYFRTMGWQIAIQIATHPNIIELLADYHVEKMIKTDYSDDDSFPYLVEKLSEKQLALSAALKRYLSKLEEAEKIETLEKVVDQQHPLCQVFSYKSLAQNFPFFCLPGTDMMTEMKTTLIQLKAKNKKDNAMIRCSLSSEEG